ncbi:MAG: hypothetical protein E3J72_01215 [Planctomycetota bacterium]|nr:MAG: hypothetical protein E3J72_01215 [Planctomycetota bacterium]
MRIHVRYCNICQKKISDLEWETGEALAWENFFYCADHAEQGQNIIDRMIREREEEELKQYEIEEAEMRAENKAKEAERRKAIEEAIKAREEARKRARDQMLHRRTQRGRGAPPRGKGFRPSKSAFVVKRKPSSRMMSPEEVEKKQIRPPAADQDAGAGQTASMEDTADLGTKQKSPAETASGIKGLKKSSRKIPSRKASAARKGASRRILPSERRGISGRHKAKKRNAILSVIVAGVIVIVVGVVILAVYMSSEPKPEKPERIERPRPVSDPEYIVDGPGRIESATLNIVMFVKSVEEWDGDEKLYSSLSSTLDGVERSTTDKEVLEDVSLAREQLENRRDTLSELAGSSLMLDVQAPLTAGDAAKVRRMLGAYPRLYRGSEYGRKTFVPFEKKIKAVLDSAQVLDELGLPDDLTALSVEKLEDFRRALDELAEFPEGTSWAKRVADSKVKVRAELGMRKFKAEEAAKKKRRQEYDIVLVSGNALIETGRPERAIGLFRNFAKKYPGTGVAKKAEAKIAEIQAKMESEYLDRFPPVDDLRGWTLEEGIEATAAGGLVTLRNPTSAEKSAGIFKGKPEWRNYTLSFSFMLTSGQLLLHVRADSKDSSQSNGIDFDTPPFRPGVWHTVKVKLSGGVLEITSSVDGVPHQLPIKAGSGGVGFRVAPGGEVKIKDIKVTIP